MAREELLDQEGKYIKSFDISQEEEYLSFFRQYGFVVIRDALSASEITSTIDEIWNDKQLLGKSGQVDRNDPSTWNNNTWPTGYGIAERGFLSFDNDYKLQVSWNNRQNPKVYKPFSKIFNTEALWVNLDRYGVMRPTKQIQLLDGTLVDKPEWITKSNWLHWDQNPWNEPNFVRVQGLVTLTDSTSTTGGFHCVPGFHLKFLEWAKSNEPKKGGIVNVPLNDPIRQEITQITMKAGSLMIWDSRLPHGNYPNESSQFRMVQYITFFPCPQGEKKEEERRRRIEPYVDAGEELLSTVSTAKTAPSALKYKFPELTELGEKILGAKAW